MSQGDYDVRKFPPSKSIHTTSFLSVFLPFKSQTYSKHRAHLLAISPLFEKATREYHFTHKSTITKPKSAQTERVSPDDTTHMNFNFTLYSQFLHPPPSILICLFMWTICVLTTLNFINKYRNNQQFYLIYVSNDNS